MSAPKRFLTENIIDYPACAEVALEGEQFNHAKNVLRLSVGAEITLLDGSGREYSAIIAACGKRDMTAHITGYVVGDKEPKTDVRLLCGALKGDKTELVVQKATELGVSRIGVFSSRYCAAYMNENKLERLRRVAREAAKQCLRASVPQVEYFPSLEEALAAGEACTVRLFACEFLDKSDFGGDETGGSVCAAVGSEGGFSEEELAAARRRGYRGISLGRRILRAETAAIALLSVVMYRAGELS